LKGAAGLPPLFSKLLATTAYALDRSVGWHRLPRPLGILTLAGLRTRLRERNLHDTGLLAAPDELVQKARDPAWTSARTIDGTLNDLRQPLMGSIGTRFGRNVPVDQTWPEGLPEILEPNPRLVSRELLTREEFIPATTLNVLAAAWLQFEVHDWFSHGKGQTENPWEIELADDDPWWERPMHIQRTLRDPTHTGNGSPPTFVTADSHWWDASQIYGSQSEFTAPCPVDQHVSDSDRIGPLEVFHAPGHSPGHLVFYWSERQVLFAGDAMATWPELSAGWPAFNLNPKQHRDSLRRMAEFDSDIVAVGHGEPIRSDGRRHVRDLTDALERNS
jgi:hypothetical protein